MHESHIVYYIIYCTHAVDFSQDLFTRKFAVKSEQEDEEQLEISFAFLTKKEMAEDPYNMTPPFSYVFFESL